MKLEPRVIIKLVKESLEKKSIDFEKEINRFGQIHAVKKRIDGKEFTLQEHLKWFIRRKDSLSIPDINIAIDRKNYIQIIEFVGNYIRLTVYWEYRERSNAKTYMQKANKIYMDLIDKNQTLLESGLLKSYKEKLNDLEKQLR